MIEIKVAKTKEDLVAFTDLPRKLYKHNDYWVEPIYKDYIAYIQGKNNELGNCPHALFLAYKDGDLVGRVLVYIDQQLNAYHGSSLAQFAEYEAIDDLDVARALINACADFAKKQGMDTLRGPYALPGGEDHRGFMINSFDQAPSIMNIYNMPYYKDQMVQLGLEKYHDTYAYTATREDLQSKVDKLERILPLVQKRYKYHIDEVDLKKGLDRELRDVYQILKIGLPKEWKDFKPVSQEEINNIFKQLKFFALEDLIVVARTNEGDPIGFALSLPDYNELLKEFKGKLGPVQIVKFFLKRKSIKRVRMFVLFVVPSYHQKGVSASMYYKVFQNAVKRGFTKLEGSTIWEYNQPMINDIEKIGAKRNIIYRIYQMDL